MEIRYLFISVYSKYPNNAVLIWLLLLRRYAISANTFVLEKMKCKTESVQSKQMSLPVPTALTCQKASVLFNTAESSVANFDALCVKSYYYSSALIFDNRCLVRYNLLLVRTLTVYRQDQKPIEQKFSRLSGNPCTEF